MDTTFIHMLGLHLLLLHLEKVSLDLSHLMEQQDHPNQLHFPPPVYGFDTFGAPGTSTMAQLHTSQSEASHPSTAEIIAQSTTASIFGSQPGMSSIATCLNSSLDTSTTSLEATTLPENSYLTSNL